jgi:hypothetical protein
MVRFGLKEVFYGITLIAIGLAVFSIPFRSELLGYASWMQLREFLAMSCLVISGAFVGAGITLPFKKVWPGVIIGAIFGPLLFFTVCRFLNSD